MNTLASVKSHLTIMGIVPMSEHHLPSALQSHRNVINFFYTSLWLISLITYSLAVLYYVLFEAETFVEYAESAFYCSVCFLHVVSYVILVQQRSKLFGLFTDSDAMVQQRKIKWNCEFISNLNFQLFVICFPYPQGSSDPVIRLIYVQENDKTTALSKSLLNSAFIFAEMFLFPNAAWSFFKYYTTDLGDDAFNLLFPSK